MVVDTDRADLAAGQRSSAPWRWALVTALGFALLAWATLGPGRMWIFDRLSMVGSALRRGLSQAQAFDALTHRFEVLPIAGGVLLLGAFLARWIGRGRFPRRLGPALFLLGGAPLLAEGIKEILPRLMGAAGAPFSFVIGFPSGHATMALSLGLAGVILAPPRWRPRLAPLAGAVAAVMNYSLFRGGFHAPGDILGAMLLTLSLAFFALGTLPLQKAEAMRIRDALPALCSGGLGLAWLLSGLGILWVMASAPPGRSAVLAAFDAGWRLVVGSGLFAPAWVALVPGGWRWRRKVVAMTLLPVLLVAGGDLLWQRAQGSRRRQRERVRVEDELLRLAWLRQVEKETVLLGNIVKWTQQGRGLRWGFAGQLPHRLRVMDQALEVVASTPATEGERQALEQVQIRWRDYRAGLCGLDARIRGGAPVFPESSPEIEALLREQERLGASLEALLALVRSRALAEREGRNESPWPAVLGAKWTEADPAA